MKNFNKVLLLLIIGTILGPFGEIYFASEEIETSTNNTLSVIQEKESEGIVTKNLKEEEVFDNSDLYSVSDYNYVETQREDNSSVNKGSEEFINLSGFKNEDKIEMDAGKSKIEFKDKKSTKQKYYVNQIGQISTTTFGNDANEIEVLNGDIVSANKAIIQTMGGYDRDINFYNSLEDAKNNVNPVVISGGAFDGQYIQTLEEDGVYYVEVLISGLDAFVLLDDIQIIPESMIKSQSHYENNNGVWFYYEALDPLMDNSYKVYPISEAPDWSSEGVIYYSYDQENFTEDQIITEDSKKVTANSYFQNLPFTSTSNYTASQYKSFLKHKGKTKSKYYNDTSAFVEAQQKESINSLILFTMANVEGGYGTSNLSNKCNNFFGWGAYDSNPDNACKEYGYTTPRDGILAQSLHLTQQFGDVDDWRYGGAEVGNKSHGINVKYASDPNWGATISSLMYETDAYLGSKEYKKYRVYEIKNSEPTYTSSSLSKTLKIQGTNNKQKNYPTPRTNGNPRVIVTKETSTAFEYQLPTPKNNSSSTTCKFTDAKKGRYSSYEGTVNNTVPKGIAQFSCEYGDFSKQKAWYPKKDAKGNITYKVINNNSITVPGAKGACDKLSKTTTESGNKVEYYNSSDSYNNCKIVYYGNSKNKKEYYKNYVDFNNKKTKRKMYKYNNSGTTTYYADTNYSTSTGYITNYKEYYYNNSGKRTQRNEKVYYSNGKAKQLARYYYNPSKLYRREMYKYKSNGKKNYYANTNYSTSTGLITGYKEYYYNDSGKRIQRNEKVYYSNGKAKQLKKYYYNSKGLYNVETYKYKTNGNKNYYANTNYSTSTGHITGYKEYYYNDSGRRIQRNEKVYYSNGKAKYKKYYYYNNDGKFKYSNVVYY